MNEEIKINPSFCNYRVDSEQNRKINEIVEGLKSGKIIGKKIISNAFDLKERLFIDIINVINQKKRVVLNHAQIDDIQYKEGVALDYALINDIKYNLLDNTFHFIFDIGNPLLKESSQLIIEMPRETLDLENVDLISHISEGSYIIDLHLIDD
ncbi:hypothetical protein E5E60_03585 [Helicobacter pylori]|nr:hypothetical protein E5E60_03585 [Helicobacter pylori]